MAAAPPRADSLGTKLRLIPLLPTALRLDAAWQRGVPGAWPAVGAFLRDTTGHDFPVLSRMRNTRMVRAVASMLRQNLDAGTSIVGLRVKVLAGVIFATVASDDALALAPTLGVSRHELDDAAAFALGAHAPPPSGDARTRAALPLARATAPSPAQIDAGVVGACRRDGLTPAAVVEVVCWLAVLQLLHRLSCYYAAPATDG